MPGTSKHSGIHGSGFDGSNLSNHCKYHNSNFTRYLIQIYSFQEHVQLLMLMKADEEASVNALLFGALS